MHVEQHTLSNGLGVILMNNPSAPVVAIDVWVGVGSADENERQGGLAHVHEHMLFKGTSRRGVGEIAREVEAAGGEINARTSFDYTVYHVEMSSRFFEVGLEILADAIQNSAFDPEELSRELEVIQEELKRGEDSPMNRTSQLLFSTVFASHPYGKPVIGESERVARYTRDDVLEFFETWYVPSNMTVSIVGDIDVEEVLASVKRHFVAPPASTPPRARLPESPQTALRLVLQEHTQRETHLQIAFPVPELTHADVPAIDVLSVLLGGGESSWLDVVIKDELQLVNSIGCYAYTPRDAGLLSVATTFQARPANGFRSLPSGDLAPSQPDGDPAPTIGAEEVLEAILSLVFGVGQRTIGDDEIQRAKTLLSSQLVYQQQSMHGLAQKFGYYQCLVGDLDFEDRYYAAIEAVTLADLRRVANYLLRPETLTVVMTSPQGEATDPEAVRAIVERASGARRISPAARSQHTDERGIHRAVLANGTTLLVQQHRTVPLVSMFMPVAGGTRYETAAQSGISALMTQLMTRGTDHLSAREIAEVSESMGGPISGYAGHNTVGLAFTVLSKHFEAAADLYVDCFANPSFEEDEFSHEQQLTLEDLHAQDDQPAGKAFRELAKLLYGEHPYSLEMMGSVESISALTTADVRDFHRLTFLERAKVVAVVGDIELEQAYSLAEQLDEAGCERAPIVYNDPAPLRGIALATHHEDKQQAHLAIGFLGSRLDEERRYCLDLASALLSGQGGRLFLELRDKQSLAYSVSAYARPDLDRGSFGFYIGTSPEKLNDALAGISAQIGRLVQECVSPAELLRAQRYLIGTHDISLQRGSTRASMMALHDHYELGHGYHWSYDDRILAVTAEDVRRCATEVFTREDAAVSVVLPEGMTLDIEGFLR